MNDSISNKETESVGPQGGTVNNTTTNQDLEILSEISIKERIEPVGRIVLKEGGDQLLIRFFTGTALVPMGVDLYLIPSKKYLVTCVYQHWVLGNSTAYPISVPSSFNGMKVSQTVMRKAESTWQTIVTNGLRAYCEGKGKSCSSLDQLKSDIKDLLNSKLEDSYTSLVFGLSNCRSVDFSPSPKGSRVVLNQVPIKRGEIRPSPSAHKGPILPISVSGHVRFIHGMRIEGDWIIVREKTDDQQELRLLFNSVTALARELALSDGKIPKGTLYSKVHLDQAIQKMLTTESQQ
jgi:hypothetical protein